MDSHRKIDAWLEIKDGNKIIGIAGISQDSLVTLIPLYDPRDRDYNGNVSRSEWLINYLSSDFVANLQGARLLKIAAVEVADPVADQIANQQMFRAAYSFTRRQIDSLYVSGLIGGSIGNFVKTLGHPIVGIFVKKGAEKITSKFFFGE